MFTKKRTKRKYVDEADEESKNESHIMLSETTVNISYWIYTWDNEFFDMPENRMFYYKSMIWSLALTCF